MTNIQITQYHSHTAFFQHINENTSIVTPNRRLSATLHKLYQQYQTDKQLKWWPTPEILPLFNWLEKLYYAYTHQTFKSFPTLLKPLQEQFLWENILAGAKENDFLLQISETAELLKSAWSLLKQWQIDINDPIFDSAEDYAALKRWGKQFENLCQKNAWIDPSALPSVITAKIENIAIKPPLHIVLIGFTEIPPHLQHLLSVCQRMGSQVDFVEIMYDQKNCHRISVQDEEEEFLTMARWAKLIKTQHPDATIGCVVPSLNQSRDRVKQVFSEVFATANAYTISEKDSPFNVSAGKNLLQYPVIYAALQLLSLHKKIIPIEIFNYILASPFVGDAENERIKRANLDNLLRQANTNHVDITEFAKEETSISSLSGDCPLLNKRFRLLLSYLANQEKNHSFSEWAKIFNECLTILGWPGERSLNSAEYQVVDFWLNFLTELMTLDYVSGSVSLPQALHQLYKIAAKTTFQPQSPDATIQILGILEAAALPFDYLWVAGLDDLTWPPQPKPNPFIPKCIQREHHMPHATAERELLFCKEITKQFKYSAPQIIFSHAEKNAEIKLHTSPLIEDVTKLEVEQLQLPHYDSPSKKIYKAKQIEYIEDQQGPVLSRDEKIVGGVDLIKQQALCPFRAFAKHRLKAFELESPTLGFRPKDRGNLIHKALEIIWNQLKDHATLTSIDGNDLNQIIRDAIHHAFISISYLNERHEKYLQLEKNRLYKLIFDWINLEKKRGAFKVATNEKKAQITLNQLQLTIRIDRIDELPDGRKFIIDYKTGKQNDVNHWFSNRPHEPQLPLYSLLDPEGTIGIAFGQVTSGEHCFKGVSCDDLEIKGVRLVSEIKKTDASSWHEQIQQWKKTLTLLSDDFYQGKAQVDPKDLHTCEYCAFKPLCRINEDKTSK